MTHPASHAAPAGIDLDSDYFTAADLDDLEAIAKRAPMTWYGTYQIVDGISDEQAVDLIEACSPDTVLTLITMARSALARNAACATPAAGLSEGSEWAQRNERVVGPQWIAGWNECRTLAASPAPAAQAVDARTAGLVAAAEAIRGVLWQIENGDGVCGEVYGAERCRDAIQAMLAASPAPETAQAFSNDGREPDWDGYAAAEAHAQQDAAPAELSIGVSNNDQGVHINIMQRHADDSCTVLYAAKCPKGDSFGRFTVAAAPSAATGKAAADHAGGLTREALFALEPSVEGALFGGEKRAFENGYYKARNAIIAMLGGATSAADAKDAEPSLSEEARAALIHKAREDWPAGFRDTPYKALDQLISAAIAASQKGTEA